jgi:hypothetical protein
MIRQCCLTRRNAKRINSPYGRSTLAESIELLVALRLQVRRLVRFQKVIASVDIWTNGSRFGVVFVILSGSECGGKLNHIQRTTRITRDINAKVHDCTKGLCTCFWFVVCVDVSKVR